MSQWSTLSSGPLAPGKSAETGSKAPKSREPVDHSVEWTTSSLRTRQHPSKKLQPGYNPRPR
ncbi:hypothetical protein GCWU000182_01141 [Abiotrophia defectiva ATCC 49176]|uniref:Uncharacterized protein n=1 Tax=Abiotrophia defectiva ATCC 49176 TaxID=592010 RepID=W1Q608_ABIDE|nr:hypothetical protein GCWU000182_01141 [Abiotrophia defectiva ATCC 49176]